MANLMMRVRAVSSGWTGGPGLNTFYFLAGTSMPAPAPDLASAELAVTRVHAAFTAGRLVWPAAWSVLVSPQVDVIRDTDGQLMDSFTASATASVVGLNTLGFGPTATGLLVQLRTNTFSDKSRIRGRAFLSPVCNSVAPSGAPTAGILSEATSFTVALADEGITATPRVCVWRRPRPARLLPPRPSRLGEAAVVKTYTVPNKFVVLRSRRD